MTCFTSKLCNFKTSGNSMWAEKMLFLYFLYIFLLPHLLFSSSLWNDEEREREEEEEEAKCISKSNQKAALSHFEQGCRLRVMKKRQERDKWKGKKWNGWKVHIQNERWTRNQGMNCGKSWNLPVIYWEKKCCPLRSVCLSTWSCQLFVKVKRTTTTTAATGYLDSSQLDYGL